MLRKIATALAITLLAAPALAQSRPPHQSVQLLQRYFSTVIDRGESGSRFWCSQSRNLETSFFAPTAYRILSARVTPDGIGRVFTVRVNSSNKGGQPVVANWTIAVGKERNPRLASNFPGGYCLTLITERD